MEKPVCFFDTNCVIYDFFDEEDIEIFNSGNADIIPAISFQTREEILHAMIANKVYNDYEGFNSFEDAWEKLDAHLDFFKSLSFENQHVERRFTKILNRLRDAYGEDFEQKYNTNIPSGMDLLHISVAEETGCQKFITADTGFEAFRDHSELFDQLEQIVLIDRETLDIMDDGRIDL